MRVAMMTPMKPTYGLSTCKPVGMQELLAQ